MMGKIDQQGKPCDSFGHLPIETRNVIALRLVTLKPNTHNELNGFP